ncbi:META domain-containing protein [Gilvimarinus sp. 1_MG-2023]|uniref:META domain-containing protein n=1 Tax=Gilvimarinus sp. 1_MG-2023 TaxID=3062638 RepID=UPI0026E2A65F|nr:META domain-containing protein [Gilvimarinus sp. 1_MG-2023]MDO6747582.1 META domain-containing protein [Gilvimarinus sp. 1_MG-2023]
MRRAALIPSKAKGLHIIAVLAVAAILHGCTTSHVNGLSPPLTGQWQVEDINQGGIIDRSMITVEFDSPNQVAGLTGCSPYTASLDATDGGFEVAQLVITRSSCVLALQMQEQRFLTAMSEAARYSIESATWLDIYDAQGNRRLRLIQLGENSNRPAGASANPKPKPKPQSSPAAKQDQSSGRLHRYHCGALGQVSSRFLGPETLAITQAEQVFIVHRELSASGARYTGKDIEFWNKGNAAQLTLNGTAYTCTSSDS